MPDLVEGLKAYLSAQSSVSTLTQLIYDDELNLIEDANMPEKAVVIRAAGGPPGPAMLQIADARVTIMCYAETPHLAWTLWETIYLALKALTPSVWSNTYIHWCKLASGGMSLRDPNMQWPYVVSSWLTRTSDIPV